MKGVKQKERGVPHGAGENDEATVVGAQVAFSPRYLAHQQNHLRRCDVSTSGA